VSQRHRIAAAFVHIPPLRERPSDITMLARAFFRQHTAGSEPGIQLQPLVAHILPGWSICRLGCPVDTDLSIKVPLRTNGWLLSWKASPGPSS